MVGTFLPEDSSAGFQVPAAKAEPQKVTNLVGTFLNEDGDDFRIIKVKTKDIILS